MDWKRTEKVHEHSTSASMGRPSAVYRCSCSCGKVRVIIVSCAHDLNATVGCPYLADVVELDGMGFAVEGEAAGLVVDGDLVGAFGLYSLGRLKQQHGPLVGGLWRVGELE